MATYVNDLRLKEIATGDEAGTWGTSTNTNLELIGEALGYGTQDCFSTDADATTTVADGATDPARAMYFKVTSSATLTATRTLTIAPNTISRVMFIENATTGSQSINISQGSGANVTIATGKTVVVYLDGAGSGAAVVDALALVDPGVTDTLAEVLAAGNTSGGTGLTMSSGDDLTLTGANYNAVWDSSDSALEFADNAKAVFGTGSDLSVYHDGSNSYIKEEGTGNLEIGTNGGNITLKNLANSETLALFNINSGVNLYYDNSAKLETTSTGISVTGDVSLSGSALISGSVPRVTLTDTDGTNTIGDIRQLSDAIVIKSRNGSSNGVIKFNGDNGTTETEYARFDANGTFLTKFGATFNEDSADVDFRVESDASANMLVVDAAENKVGINRTPNISNSKLEVGGADNVPIFNVEASGYTGGLGIGAAGLQLFHGSSSKVLIASGGMVINENSADFDFRVESNNNEYALFVDGGADKTMFNTSYSADGGVVSIRGTYGANNASDYRGNNALALTGADPGTTAAGSGINLAFVPVTNRGATAVISGENVSTNKEGGAQLRFSVGGGAFPTTQKDTLMLNYDSGAIFNEGSADLDFRVESDSNTHMLFVDAGTNRVGINDSAPDKSLHVSSAGTAEIRVQNSTNSYALDLGMNDELGQVKASANIALLPGGAEKWLIDSSGNATQTNTSGGSGSGPYYDLHRDSGSPAANDLGPIIRFRGDNSAGGVHTYANIYTQFTDVTDAGEDCTVHHQVSVAGTPRSVLSLKGNAEVSVNEESQNIDFRVESDGATHMLFVDAGANRVGINDSSPAYTLDVAGNIHATSSIIIGDGSSSPGTLSINDNSGTAYVLDIKGTGTREYTFEGSSSGGAYNLYFNNASVADGMNVHFYGSAFFNQNGDDYDFRVESNNNANMLFVEGGTDRVGIGTNDPQEMLYIRSTGADARFGIDAPTGYDAEIKFSNNATVEYTIGHDDATDLFVIGTTNVDTPAITLNKSGFAGFGGNTSPLVNIHSKSTSTGEQLRLESTDSGGAYGPIMGLHRNSSSPADSDGLGVINFYGEDSASNITTYASISAIVQDVSNGTEDGRLVIQTQGDGSDRNRVDIRADSLNINEDGQDTDFRVESNNNANMLFVDAGNDRVGVGLSAPDSTLEVNGTVNINGIYHTEATQKFLTASTANDLVSVAFGSAQTGVYVKIKYRSTKNDGGVVSHVAGEELFIFRSDSTTPAVATTSTNTGSNFLTFTTAQDTGNNKLTVKVNPGAAANFADITYTLEVIPRNVGTTPTITHL